MLKICTNLRTIYKKENGKLKEIVVDWNQLPCKDCEARYSLCCPRPQCLNKDGKYMIYSMEKLWAKKLRKD